MSARTTAAALSSQVALRPVALGLSLLVVVGGHSAYEAAAHTVAITVDGVRQQVTTHGGTVGAALAAAHLHAGSHDLLAPSASTPIKDGSRIVLRRGRQMTLTVDGTSRIVWVTATSVDEALAQIGLPDGGSLLSADRSRAIPLKGFSLDVRTRKDIQVLDGGTVRRTATNALHVYDVLQQLRIHVRPTDTLSAAPTQALRDGMVISITRRDGDRVSQDIEIPFATETRQDPTLYRGLTKVLRAGRVGVLHKTYLLSYTNHHLTGRRIASIVRTAAPVARVVAVGTETRPQPRYARSVSAPASSGGLNWAALARCESGGNPRAVSSDGTYRGLYQFSLSTWHGVGGSGDPIDASSSEQTNRAEILYRRSGRGSWPVCGQYL